MAIAFSERILNIILFIGVLIILFNLIIFMYDYYLNVRFLSNYIAVKIFYKEYHTEILKKDFWILKKKIYFSWNGKYLVVVYLSPNEKKADKTFISLIKKTDKAYQKLDIYLKNRYRKEYEELLLLKQIITDY